MTPPNPTETIPDPKLTREDVETFTSTALIATEPQAFAYEMARQRIKSKLRAALSEVPGGEEERQREDEEVAEMVLRVSKALDTLDVHGSPSNRRRAQVAVAALRDSGEEQ